MIRIHTGGCPMCGSPIFVEFEQVKNITKETLRYAFQGDFQFYGEIGSVIHSCECVVKAEPEAKE